VKEKGGGEGGSGEAKGYARFAPAYPAIPANACIYIRIFLKKYTNMLLLHD
jgi:hypothetical protein